MPLSSTLFGKKKLLTKKITGCNKSKKFNINFNTALCLQYIKNRKKTESQKNTQNNKIEIVVDSVIILKK
jgi:hypothetical protein